LVTSVVGDRCANCQAPLAPDQRYCVNCGERRGMPRFSYESMAAPAVAEATMPPRQRSRFPQGTSLIAGVATLLIAMGVGVLIGHDSNSSTPARALAPQVITVGGGAATGGATGTPTTSAATTGGSGKAAKGKAKVTTVHVTAKAAKAATSSAAKVLGSGGNLSNNVTQSVGGTCSGGSGCQGGKFTGNFFPGG
jgi:hypothetical protein